MLQPTCMNVFQTAEHLVQEELMMLWRQVIIGLDDLHSTLYTLNGSMAEHIWP